jgi:type I restriction enzyme, S subunit
MSDWAPVSVGELCDAGLAELQTGPFGTQLHAYDYVKEGIPVVPTEAIRDRQIDRLVLPKISRAKADELERHKLRPGDILFARRGVQATGHIGFVRDAEAGFICGTGAILLRVTENNPKVSAEFLSHIFANPASIAWFKFHAIGATMPNLNEGIIRAFTFSLPPLEEQKRIAVLLSGFDDKIEVLRQMNETLEAIASLLFKDWFVSFGPTRAKSEGLAPYLADHLWALFPNTFNEDGIPSGWNRSTVSGIAAQWKSSITPSLFADEQFDHYSIPAYDDNQMPAPDFGRTILSNKTEVPPDAVLLSKLNPEISRVWLTSTSGTLRRICSTEFLVFRAKRSFERAYLYSLFVDPGFRGRLVGMVTGTSKSHQRVSPQNVLDTPIALPTSEETILESFSEIVDPLLSRILQNREESRSLSDLRDLLLPKLVSEEIRLRAAEKLVNEVA